MLRENEMHISFQTFSVRVCQNLKGRRGKGDGVLITDSDAGWAMLRVAAWTGSEAVRSWDGEE